MADGAASAAASGAAAGTGSAAAPATGTGTGTESAAAAKPASGRSQNPPASGQSAAAEAAAATRPDYIQEKHWDAEKRSVKIDDLGKAYDEATKQLSKRKDDLRKDVDTERLAKRPAKVDDYKLERSSEHKLPDGVKLEFSRNNPFIAALADVAHENGLDQAAFSKVLDKVADKIVATAPQREAEWQKLGGEETGRGRVQQLKMWGEASLGAEAFKTLLGPNPTAAHVMALEVVMNKLGGPRMSQVGAQQQQQQGKPKTLSELRTMQADPRYSDPRKRDAEFVKQVDAEYRRAYSGTIATAEMNPRGRR